MKNLLLFLLLPMVAMALNSCETMGGGDDNGNGNGNGNGSTKLVKQLTKKEATYYFDYDDRQRINKVTITYDGSRATVLDITYSGNTITRVFKNNYHESTSVITLNSEGYVVKSEYYGVHPEHNTPTHPYEDYTYSGGLWEKTTWFPPPSTSYTYMDADGELITITIGEEEEREETYTWRNGNLIVVKENDGDTRTYTYNDIEDKMNIVVSDIHDYIGDEVIPFFISRFKGMTSKNLMSKKDYSRPGDTHIFTFEYTLDEDGYPTEIVEKLNGEYNDSIEVYYY